MYALLCKDGAKDIIAASDGIFSLRHCTKMSEVLELHQKGALEGIWIDQRLAVTQSMRERFPEVPIFEFEVPFMISDAMRWYEMLRVSSNVESSEEVGVTREEKVTTSIGARSGSEMQFRQRRVPVWMLVSPKGGEGRSTLGAHMSYFGAMKGKKVAVIDADPQGNIANMFGLLESVDARGWRGHSVDQAVRDGACLVHESGLHLFPSPQDREVVLQNPEDTLHLLRVCMQEMDYVFVDMPQGWTPTHTAILSFVSQIFVVVSPRVDRLDRIQDFMEKLAHAGLDHDQVAVFVNQSRKRSDLRGVAQRTAPYEPFMRLPFDAHLAEKGGLSGKKLIRACSNWWHEIYGLRKPEKSKWWLFRRM